MNIILVVIDTLRYDYIGANNREQIHTPNLDRFASTALVFDNAFAGSYPTIPHRTDVITGRTGSPFHAWLPLRFDAPTLPRHLERAGYSTQLIHDTPHLVNGGHAFDYPFHGWTFVRGAEVDRPWIDDGGFRYLDNWTHDPFYDYMGSAESAADGDLTLPTYSRANRHRTSLEDWNAARLFSTVCEFLNENARRDRFFLWVDCFDPHEPWDAPPEFVSLYGGGTRDGRIDPRCFLHAARNLATCPDPAEAARRYRNLYAAKVSWMDACFGRMLDTLESTGLKRNTAIIVTSDHGTNVGERGIITKSFSPREQEARIPLMIAFPGCRSARLSAIVQPHDIYTTVLSLAGADADPGAEGTDLLTGFPAGSPRKVALCGGPPTTWGGGPEKPLFTVFGEEDYLVCTAAPHASHMYRLGHLDEVTLPDPRRSEALRAAALEELERRGTNPLILAWLRSGGEDPFPAEQAGRRADPGWTHYFMQNYRKW